MRSQYNNIQQYLISVEDRIRDYKEYYQGKITYPSIYGAEWREYIRDNYPNILQGCTSENVFRSAVDIYRNALTPHYLSSLSNNTHKWMNTLIIQGETVIVKDKGGNLFLPENPCAILTDGNNVTAMIRSMSIADSISYITFVSNDGGASVWGCSIEDVQDSPQPEDYHLIAEETGYQLAYVTTGDTQFGAGLAAIQDRINHSIINQTIIAEMYARPFWYLLNTTLPPHNPYLAAEEQAPLASKSTGSSGRIFVTSSQGPFGQLMPPTIQDMIDYHDSLIDKVSNSTGIPQYYIHPGKGTPPTGVALKILTTRFNQAITSMREVMLSGIRGILDPDVNEDYLWPNLDEILQDSTDAHGLALSQMGYPLEYIASVVTPGVDLTAYGDDM